MRTTRILVSLVALGIAAACGSSTKEGFGASGGGDGAGSQGGDGGSSLGQTSGSSEAGATAPQSVVAHVTGKVVAPEGTIPISGALVYLASTAPPAIPQQTFCDKCVQITDSTPYTYSKADGTFDLGAFTTGPQILVVQKGQFRRARPLDVEGATLVAPLASTTLPNKTDATAGDYIPKMAVVQAQWDAIEVSLAKLGLGTVQSNVLGATVKNAPFDIVNESLLTDPTKLAQYNIVFVGCSFSDGTTCNTSQPSGDSAVQKNLRDFVSAGGKLYTTDYSYEFVRQPWPGFVHWDGEAKDLGSACQSGSYDATASVGDPGLAAWLTAIGQPNPTLEQSWTSISSVASQMGTDENGDSVTITPKVWLSGDVSGTTKPMTVSFQSGCGRVLFSTYHTEGSGDSTLLAQEKALLYVLLEVGVCVGTQPPPK